MKNWGEFVDFLKTLEMCKDAVLAVYPSTVEQTESGFVIRTTFADNVLTRCQFQILDIDGLYEGDSITKQVANITMVGYVDASFKDSIELNRFLLKEATEPSSEQVYTRDSSKKGWVNVGLYDSWALYDDPDERIPKIFIDLFNGFAANAGVLRHALFERFQAGEPNYAPVP